MGDTLCLLGKQGVSEHWILYVAGRPTGNTCCHRNCLGVVDGKILTETEKYREVKRPGTLIAFEMLSDKSTGKTGCHQEYLTSEYMIVIIFRIFTVSLDEKKINSYV